MRVRACLLVLTLSVMPAVQLFAQKIVKQWEARYSEPGYTVEAAEQVETDANGNAFVLGTTNEDAILLKYNPSGQIQWTFQAGRGVLVQGWGEPTARDFVVDGHGNSYLAVYGYTPSTQSYGTAIIKIDTDGKEVWRKMLGGYYDRPHTRMALLGDNSFVVFHKTSYKDLTLTRLSTTGDVLWTKTVNNPGDIEDVRFLNNSIVAYYNAGRYAETQKSYLAVYSTDGTLAWEKAYLHDEKDDTTLIGLCYYNNEFIVTYYIYAGTKRYNQVFRYNAATGGTVGNFTIYMDYSFYDDTPMEVTVVGDDGEIMVVEADNLEVRKYSLDGTLLWSKKFQAGSEYRYSVLQAWPQPATSSVDVLLKTTRLTSGTETYTVTSFMPNKTSTVVADLSAARRDVVPVRFWESGTDVFFAGTSYKDANYKEDLTLTKLTSDVHAWTTTYSPVNSLTNVPTCMATDAQGNVYVAGMLWVNAGSSAFGAIKYDATGKQVWVKRIAPDATRGGGGTLSFTMALAIAVNTNQEVYITGVVDAGNMYNPSSREAPRDLYTIKLDANGNTVWTQKAPSITDDNYAGYQMALDSQNNLYVLGYDHNREVNGRMQMVLLKYNGSGALLWEQRFGVYPDYLFSAVPINMPPVLKIFNDEAYVLYRGLYMQNSDDRDVVELRKFTSGGTGTLVWQKQCSEIDGDRKSHAQAGELYLGTDGTVYVAYSYYFEGRDIYGRLIVYNSELRIQALKPSGEKLWDKSWPVETGSVNRMALAGGGTQLHLLGITTTNFHYISVAPQDGNEHWYETEALTEDRNYFGRRGFAFTKANGNALFASSDVTSEDGSAYYFVSERDQKTGAVVATEIFDEIYDAYGGSSYYRPADMLMGACLSADLQSLFMTGSIQDKGRVSETIVTLMYSLADTNNGNDGDDDGDDDNSGDGDDDGDDDDNPVTSIEPGAEQALAAYPTLNRGVFQIHGLTRESTEIQVFDTFGQYVCHFDPAAEYFDLTERPAGIYLIRIQHRGQWYTTKIMKE